MKKNNDLTTSFSFHWSPVQKLYGGFFVNHLNGAYGIYKLFELFVRRKERMAMIEKMSFGDGMVVPPDVTKLFSPPIPTFGALRIGLLLTGLGLGLVLAIFMNSYLDWLASNAGGRPGRYFEVLYLAFMLLFGGLGLVIAYLMEQKNRKKD